MSNGKDAPSEQILIVRRRGHDSDDHHHGGVWKIAYADFMTAMMAFFLVMWLINASNTETKASVASYFNPIKLTDTASRTKGVRDATKSDGASDTAGKLESEKKKLDQKENKKRSSHDDTSDKEDKHQSQAGSAHKSSSASRKSDRAAGAAANSQDSDRSLHDPFNPFKSMRSPRVEDATTAVTEGKAEQAGTSSRAPNSVATSGPAQSSPAGETNPTKATEVAINAAPSSQGSSDAQSERRTKALTAAADRIGKEALAAVGRLGISSGPGVDVTIEDESIVLSLTDTSTFGMFAVGSAEPNAEVLKLIQSITPILAASGDRIVVRGHTDSRPYRSDKLNNNWRLSMARAEAAYGMLVRAGIEESRFERIEAHADRKPRIATEPTDAPNRRIEIILRNVKQ